MPLKYDKKMIAIIVAAVVLAGASFYAGAKYEKNKLDRLGLLKGSKSSSVKKAKNNPTTDKATTGDDNATTGNPSDATPGNTAPSAAAPSVPTAPNAAPKTSMPVSAE